MRFIILLLILLFQFSVNCQSNIDNFSNDKLKKFNLENCHCLFSFSNEDFKNSQYFFYKNTKYFCFIQVDDKITKLLMVYELLDYSTKYFKYKNKKFTLKIWVTTSDENGDNMFFKTGKFQIIKDDDELIKYGNFFGYCRY